MCVSVGVRESTNVCVSGSEGVDECVCQWECGSRRMRVAVGVRESTNVSLSGSEGVDECVSQWE